MQPQTNYYLEIRKPTTPKESYNPIEEVASERITNKDKKNIADNHLGNKSFDRNETWNNPTNSS